MTEGRRLTRVGSLVLASTANLVLFGLLFFVAVPSSGWHGPATIVATLVVYGTVGAAASLWSRSVVSVVLPSWVSFLGCLGMLKWSIHLTDTRGQYAPQMWRYVVSPSQREILLSCAVVIAVAGGSFAGSKLRKRQRSAGR